MSSIPSPPIREEFSPPPPPLLQYPQAFREGGEDGVVEGLAPRERRLPPPEGLGGGVEGLEVCVYICRQL